MSLYNIATNTFDSTTSLSSFVPQPAWGHTTGSTIQSACHHAYSQVIGEDSPYVPLGGGPYTFSSGICSIGVYLVRPGDVGAPVVHETWKNIKDSIQHALLSFFLFDNQSVGSVINLSSGVQICIYEPVDADPEHLCMFGTPYAQDKTLTLQECLDQHKVVDLTSEAPSTSSNLQQQAHGIKGDLPSAPHGNDQQAQAMSENLPSSTSHSTILQQTQAIMADLPSTFQSNRQHQAQSWVGELPDLNQSIAGPPSSQILKLRGDWTNRPITATHCQQPLQHFRFLTMQRSATSTWTLRKPMMYSNPPCTLGLYVTIPNPTGGPTSFFDSWRNIGDYLHYMIYASERGDLGAFINLPSGVQIVLYNGAWLDPQFRLEESRASSLLSELNGLSALMTANRLRNLTELDRQFSARLLSEWFYQ